MDEWESRTHRFSISGHKGYVTVATDEHGQPVLLEIRMAKAGGVLRGLLDSLAASVSLGLQRGVPLSAYVERLALPGWPHCFPANRPACPKSPLRPPRARRVWSAARATLGSDEPCQDCGHIAPPTAP